MSIISILNQVKDNEIVLPAIQRSFVWGERKIELLLDSIMRGYPIGISMLWETYEDLQYRTFQADFAAENKHVYKSNSQRRKLRVVLDGQQRLQSLYVALYGTYEKRHLYLDILSGYDLDDSSEERYFFWFLSTEDATGKNQKALAAFRDSGQTHADPSEYSHFLKVQDLFRLLASQKRECRKRISHDFGLEDDGEALIEANIARLDEIFTRDDNVLKISVIDQDLPSESPARKSESDILEMFVRINRQGTPLSRSDLIFSMLKLNWRESSEALPTFVDEVNTGNSFELDADFVIRCLYAVSDLGTKFDVDMLRQKSNIQTIKKNFARCCAAIKSAVDFIQEECWCSNTRVLGGPNTLVPIVYFLFHLPKQEVPIGQISDLRKAVYVLGFTSPFSRYSDSRTAKFIREELKPLDYGAKCVFPLGRTISRATYWAGINAFDDQLIQRNPCLALQVIQRLGGAKAKYKPNSHEMDHIFPRSELRDRGYDEALINHFANFWLLARGKNQNKSNRHPKTYFADVPESEMRRAFIDRQMLEYNRYRAFIKKRAEAIREEIKQVLNYTENDLAWF